MIIRTLSVAGLALACTLPAAFAQTRPSAKLDASPQEKLTVMLAGQLDPVVSYCNRKLPGNANVLNDAYRVAKASIALAAGEYVAEVGSDVRDLDNPDAIAKWREYSELLLVEVKRLDPARYCTWLPGNLLKLTPEIALQQFREGYQAAKKARSQGGAQ